MHRYGCTHLQTSTFFVKTIVEVQLAQSQSRTEVRRSRENSEERRRKRKRNGSRQRPGEDDDTLTAARNAGARPVRDPSHRYEASARCASCNNTLHSATSFTAPGAARKLVGDHYGRCGHQLVTDPGKLKGSNPDTGILIRDTFDSN